LISHVPGIKEAKECGEWTPLAQTLAEAFWPGPLTLIVKRRPIIPPLVSAGLSTIALRAPGHPAARRLMEACGFPIAAPSANRSGRPSPTTAAHVLADMQGRIPLILDGGPCEVGLESTVADASGALPLILRPGAVTMEMIAMVTGECLVAESVMRALREGEAAPSPGMRHRHYAPSARLTLVEGGQDAVRRALRSLACGRERTWVLALDGTAENLEGIPVQSLGKDAKEAAHRLFHLLRRADEEGIRRIYAQTLPRDGLGLAVMNRLARASGFDILDADSFDPGTTVL
jgi:L-threonylcarbamoyladenylate synthase